MASIWDQLEALRLSNEVSGPTMRATPENPLQRWMRQKSVALADAIGGENTLASRQIEEGLTGLGAVLAGGLEPGGPERAGLVLSARNVPKLRAAMEAALKGTKRAPEDIALAFAEAKYPKLSKIADFTRQPDFFRPGIYGDYSPDSNVARIFTSETRKPEEFVNTVMHESMHARQALRRRPKEQTDAVTGEIQMDPEAHRRALLWKVRYETEQLKARNAALEHQRSAIMSGTPPDRAKQEAHDVMYNYYRYKNPYERTAWQAGETARNTFRDFQRFDTTSRPGHRSRILDRVRDWMDQFLTRPK